MKSKVFLKIGLSNAPYEIPIILINKMERKCILYVGFKKFQVNKELNISLKVKLYLAVITLLVLVLLVYLFPNAITFSLVNILGVLIFVFITISILKG
jgi:hypothetical protein